MGLRGFSFDHFRRKREIVESFGDPTTEGFLEYRPPTGAYIPPPHSQRVRSATPQAQAQPYRQDYHPPASVPPNGVGGSSSRGDNSPSGFGDRYGTPSYVPPPQVAGRPAPSNGQPYYQNGTAGGGSKRKKEMKGATAAANGRWANTMPAANTSAAGPSGYSNDSMDDSEDDKIDGGPGRAPSVSTRGHSRPTSVAPPLIDPTGGGERPPGAPENWGRSKRKRTRLKGNVDFGKRPSKGRMDQRAPGSSDKSDDSVDDRRPHRSYGWEDMSDSEDSDGNPLGGRLPHKRPGAAVEAARGRLPPEPSERPPLLLPSPPPVVPALASMSAAVVPAQSGRKVQALEHFEALRQQRRKRDAHMREVAVAPMPPPPPPPPPLPPKSAPPSPPPADEWGPSGGWSATRQPSDGWSSWNETPQPDVRDDDRMRREEEQANWARRPVDPRDRRTREQAPGLASPSPVVTDKDEPLKEVLATPSAASLETAAPDAPDVKPVIALNRPESPASAPAPPPPWAPSGVSSWSLDDLPVDCRPSRVNNDYILNRERFKFIKRHELSNECRRVTKTKWIAGELAIDWTLDTSVGIWTVPYPSDCKGKVARKAFRDTQLDIVQAKGWQVTSADDTSWPGGDRNYCQISWLDERPLKERERALGWPDPAPEPSPSLSFVPRLTPPSAPPAEALSGGSLPTPVMPANLPFRVKSEPMDLDDALAIPPPATVGPSSAVLPYPAVPGAGTIDSAADVVSKEEQADPTEMPTSLTAALNAASGVLPELIEHILAADRNNDDLAAIEQAERLLADQQKMMATVGRRLEIMRRRLTKERR